MEADDSEINVYLRIIKYDLRIIASLMRNKHVRHDV
jgi:hypothetical protein